MKVVLDTNVVVAGLRSRLGASFRVLELIGTGQFEMVLTVPLVLEYEDALQRGGLTVFEDAAELGVFLDYLCSVAQRQTVFFLWRPRLRDPGDDMVLEAAVAAQCDAIVTFNRRDFVGCEEFGVAVWTPGKLLEQLGGSEP